MYLLQIIKASVWVSVDTFTAFSGIGIWLGTFPNVDKRQGRRQENDDFHRFQAFSETPQCEFSDLSYFSRLLLIFVPIQASTQLANDFIVVIISSTLT